ncbi:hypothetical protein G9A89_000609, partial [Geosiphon pyriformis]
FLGITGTHYLLQYSTCFRAPSKYFLCSGVVNQIFGHRVFGTNMVCFGNRGILSCKGLGCWYIDGGPRDTCRVLQKWGGLKRFSLFNRDPLADSSGSTPSIMGLVWGRAVLYPVGEALSLLLCPGWGFGGYGWDGMMLGHWSPDLFGFVVMGPFISRAVLYRPLFIFVAFCTYFVWVVYGHRGHGSLLEVVVFVGCWGGGCFCTHDSCDVIPLLVLVGHGDGILGYGGFLSTPCTIWITECGKNRITLDGLECSQNRGFKAITIPIQIVVYLVVGLGEGSLGVGWRDGFEYQVQWIRIQGSLIQDSRSITFYSPRIPVSDQSWDQFRGKIPQEVPIQVISTQCPKVPPPNILKSVAPCLLGSQSYMVSQWKSLSAPVTGISCRDWYDILGVITRNYLKVPERFVGRGVGYGELWSLAVRVLVAGYLGIVVTTNGYGTDWGLFDWGFLHVL